MKRKVLAKGFGIILSLSMVLAPLTVAGPITSEAAGEDIELKTIYNKPAENWESEALPLGNGFMGAMVFGGVENDRIQINEHTLWSGGPGANEDYNGGHSSRPAAENKQLLTEVRAELQDNMTRFTAEKSAWINDQGEVVSSNYPSLSSSMNAKINALKGNKDNFGSYQSLGNIYISDPGVSYNVPVSVISNSKTITEGERPDKLFDYNTATKWYSLAGTPAGTEQDFPVWVTAEYTKPISFDRYTLMSGNDVEGRDPKSWILYGSDDGEHFEIIDEQNDAEFTGRRQERSFLLDKQVSCRYIRFEVSENRSGRDSDGVQLTQLLFETGQEENNGYTNYQRSLDLNQAVAEVAYVRSGVQYHSEYWVSNPGNVMAVRMTADQEGVFNKVISINTPQSRSIITAEDDTITMTGRPQDHGENGLVFAQQIKVVAEGGTVEAEGGTIIVEGADSILLLMSAGTNYRQCTDDTFDYFTEEDPLDGVKARIQTASEKTYETLKADHIADYKSLFDNMTLNLDNASLPAKTTPQLLAGYGSGNTAAEDRYLEMLYFQFGRYLLIASSRDGSLPANLQGIWADGLNPPWDSDYHTNINVQMNYWLAEQTNLSECHRPMIDYINSLVPRGTITAQTYHVAEDGSDVRGWTTYHENNIWGNTAPAVSGAYYFPAGAAWLCQDIWEVYAFNLDKTYLAENFNTMLQAALFWVDNLVTDTRDGTLVSSPSWSPEHGEYSLGTTADQAIIHDLFDKTIQAAEVLGIHSAEVTEIRNAMSRLSGPSIGLAGQFQEWKDEITMDITGDGGHRHVNHLHGLHPGNQIVAGRSEQDDQYVEAMKVTLNTRGDGGTGWSKAWKINFWARLRDGDRAQVLLKELLRESTLDNLFDTHPPFQIDGNFGATAGMAEMLLQSQGDSIDLLAATPAVWTSGSATGMKARGNVEVDLEWKYGELLEGRLRPAVSQDMKIRLDNIATATVKTAGADAISFDVEDDHTIVIHASAGQEYVITDIRNEAGTKEALQTLNELIAQCRALLAEKTPDVLLYNKETNDLFETDIAAAEKAAEEKSDQLIVIKDITVQLQSAMEKFIEVYSTGITADLEAGIYQGKRQLKLEASNKALTIHYTRDGSEPTAESDMFFTTIFLPYGKTTIKAAVFLDGKKVSDSMVLSYMITGTENMAEGQSASAPDTATISGYPAGNAVDGNMNSRWATNGNTATLQINFDNQKQFNTFVIREFVERSEATRTKSYVAEYYDGTDWVEFDRYVSEDPSDNHYPMLNDTENNPRQLAQMASEFEMVSAQQIRIRFSAYKEISLYEFEVYDSCEEIDTTYLEQMIADAQTIDLDAYEDSEDVETALARAIQVLSSYNSQQEADEAAADLRAALYALIGSDSVGKDVEKKYLKVVIDYAEEILASDEYPGTTIAMIQKMFEDALSNAQKIYDKTDATQQETDEAKEVLVTAIQYLKFTADLKSLQDAIDHAQYTADSGLYEEDADMAAYRALLEEAKDILKDPMTLDEDIDDIIARLAEAEAKLNQKATLDLRFLLEEIRLAEIAEKVLAEKYLDLDKDDFKVFREALAAAKTVLESPQSQDEIDNAAAKLLKARMNLRLKPSKDALKDLMDIAAGKKAADYTPMSFSVLQKARDKAQEIFDDPQATEKEIGQAMEELQAALDQLVSVRDDDKKPGGDDKKPGGDDKTSGGNDKTPDDDNKGTVTGKDSRAVKGGGAKTGDGNMIMLSVVLMLLSLAGVSLAVIQKRKRNQRQQ